MVDAGGEGSLGWIGVRNESGNIEMAASLMFTALKNNDKVGLIGFFSLAWVYVQQNRIDEADARTRAARDAGLPRVDEIRLDPMVLVFTAISSAFTYIVPFLRDVTGVSGPAAAGPSSNSAPRAVSPSARGVGWRTRATPTCPRSSTTPSALRCAVSARLWRGAGSA